MFKVTEKETRKVFDVYDITYDAVTGYPQFLIYKDGQWLRVSAKKFEPTYPAEEVYEFDEGRLGCPGPWYEED